MLAARLAARRAVHVRSARARRARSLQVRFSARARLFRQSLQPQGLARMDQNEHRHLSSLRIDDEQQESTQHGETQPSVSASRGQCFLRLG